MTSPGASLYSPGGLPAPNLDDEPNVPADLMALAVSLDPMVETRFATTSQRDTTWSADVAPLGARSFVPSSGRQYVRWQTTTLGAKWYEVVEGALLVADTGERDALDPKPPGLRVKLGADGHTQTWTNGVWVSDAAEAWLPYQPTIQGGSGFAEGTKTNWRGKYKKTGSTVIYQFDTQFAAGFAQGTGQFYMSMPVAPAPLPSGMLSGWISGAAWLWSGSSSIVAVPRVRADGRLEFLYNGGAFAGSGAPWAWGGNAQISGAVTYEVAP